ncbi:dCTP deaminase [Vibrio campbellii]|uniref:Deoxycytidine deaminase n=1 Tax=Vibrio campbellii (strain ATCC BAA-1116) TaxID=2902295 RepID=A7N6S4_VIBC1|nr:deoxycytidine deaminase [Vibrio campbellii]ABU73962.1 hypothetical protein VIBHAR_06069 [Vibrio campbellii ATCC BAA-1116]AGU98466.1 hypothetical protein M892_21565 [Vibrio campbellii ATCC BAA-1116]MBT0124172.1 deoxycytidine deaminase [Vibrio campbellii]MBT0139104.1 deoxycytidine deaminase [Vibrio campbellii]MBT0143804.1 deoxycytidine deaminase [Vibrio campbellii]
MILTGSEIRKQRALNTIQISPFCEKQVNPNSYNYRLGPTLKVFDEKASEFFIIEIPEEGYILEPHKMYLGHTMEVLGSDIYAMRLIGRSSLGRYGLFLQVSADLGHTTSCHQWTLELVATQPIRLYSNMIIGQISFWNNFGDISCFGKTFANFNTPTEGYR